MASFLTKSGLPKQVPVSYGPSKTNTQVQQPLFPPPAFPSSQQNIRIQTSPSQAKFDPTFNSQSVRPLASKINSLQKSAVQSANHRQTVGLPHLQNNRFKLSETPNVQYTQPIGVPLQTLSHQPQKPQTQTQPLQKQTTGIQSLPRQIKTQNIQNVNQNTHVTQNQQIAKNNIGQNPVQTHMETVKQFQNLVNQIKGLVHHNKPSQTQSGQLIQEIEMIQQAQPIRYHVPQTQYQAQPYNLSQVQQATVQPYPRYQVQTHPQQHYQFDPSHHSQTQNHQSYGLIKQHQRQENPSISSQQQNLPYTLINSGHPRPYPTPQTINKQLEQMFQQDQVVQQNRFNQIQYQQQLQVNNGQYHQPENNQYIQEEDHQIVFKSKPDGLQSPTQSDKQYLQYQKHYQQLQFKQHYQPQYQPEQHHQQEEFEITYQQNTNSKQPHNPSSQTYQLEELKQIVFGDQPYEQIGSEQNKEYANEQSFPLSDRKHYENQPNIQSSHQREHHIENQDFPQELLEYEAEQKQNQYAESQRLHIIQAINTEIEQEKRQSHSKRQSHNTRNPNFMMYLDGVDLLSYYDLHQKLLNDKDELAALYQQSFGLDAK